MTVYGFDREEDAAALLELLNQPPPRTDGEPRPQELSRPVSPPSLGVNARWFAKTPSAGIAACNYGTVFDDNSSDWTLDVPAVKCKLYLVTADEDDETITVTRFLADGDVHVELLIGNLLNEPIPGNIPIGFNRAVGGALIADWSPCDA